MATTRKSTVKDAYLALSTASGIKVGDTVRVLRKAKSNEMGWTNNWDGSKDGGTMDDLVGKTFVVELDRGTDGFYLKGGDYYVPFFILEKISPPIPTEKKVTIYGADVRFLYSPTIDDVIVFPGKHDYQFRIGNVKEIVKTAEEFLNQHREAKKA